MGGDSVAEAQPISESSDGAPAPVCRICLSEDGAAAGDCLLAPCQCRGSIAHVHLGCLRHWAQSRLSVKESSADGGYTHRPQACELCKSPLPAYVRHNNAAELEPLVDVPKTQPPFVVLETVTRDPRHPNQRGTLHVVSLAGGQTLTFGRDRESSVRITDGSISRHHASMRYDTCSRSFILQDCKSKFGTLLAMRKRCDLRLSETVEVQMGRTVLSMTLQPFVDPATVGMVPCVPWVSVGTDAAQVRPEPLRPRNETTDSVEQVHCSSSLAGDVVDDSVVNGWQVAASPAVL